MSSFICERCAASIIDTPDGYVTECGHYPLGDPADHNADAGKMVPSA